MSVECTLRRAHFGCRNAAANARRPISQALGKEYPVELIERNALYLALIANKRANDHERHIKRKVLQLQSSAAFQHRREHLDDYGSESNVDRSSLRNVSCCWTGLKLSD